MVQEPGRSSGQGHSKRALAAARLLWGYLPLALLVLLQISPSRAQYHPSQPHAVGAAHLQEGLPPALVVHGRRGANSNINGVYFRDHSWEKLIGPCYRRGGPLGQTTIYLWFEGEWRMGPSPEEGRVWAFSSSTSASPLEIDAPWQVWDGQSVREDAELRISDTSTVPPVIFLSVAAGAPEALSGVQGMLLQQPGLWDGRPYYRHRVWQDLFLLCSVAEGRWRLGPLPVEGGAQQSGRTAPDAGVQSTSTLLFAHSAAALPQEIAEPWFVPEGARQLPEGAIRLAVGGNSPELPFQPHPRHLVVEGLTVAEGIANGVYKRAEKLHNLRPVYHKTDALRPACLWFDGSDWRFGPQFGSDRVWAYCPSHALSPLTLERHWHTDNEQLEVVRITDAAEAIPASLWISGEQYAQQPRLCDARPVYQQVRPEGPPSDEETLEVFLFFRAQEEQWWLGPIVGGVERIASAYGSRLLVVPDPEGLTWHFTPPDQAHILPSMGGQPRPAERPQSEGGDPCCGSWLGMVLATAGLGLLGMLYTLVVDQSASGLSSGSWLPSFKAGLVGFLWPHEDWSSLSDGLAPEGAVEKVHSKGFKFRRRPSGLSCVVCLEAPREILLLPCRHVCCCKACADRLERCPMCRAEKTAFTKVFL